MAEPGCPGGAGAPCRDLQGPTGDRAPGCGPRRFAGYRRADRTRRRRRADAHPHSDPARMELRDSRRSAAGDGSLRHRRSPGRVRAGRSLARAGARGPIRRSRRSSAQRSFRWRLRVRSVRNGGSRSPGLLALLVGLVLVVGALLRLGFLTDLLSKPIRIGYLNGVALVVIVGQLPALLGFSTDGDGLVEEAGDLVAGIADGQVQPAAASIGIAALTVILVLRRAAPLPVPGCSSPSWRPAPRCGPSTLRVCRSWDPAQWSPRPRHWAPSHKADAASLVGPALGVALVALRRHRCAVEAFRGAGDTDVDPGSRDGGAGPGQCRLRARPAGSQSRRARHAPPSPRRPGHGRNSPASWVG